MVDMERELTRQLRRAPAPPGFADGVMRAIDRRRRGRRLLAAAAILCVAIPAPVLVRQYRQTVRAAEAQRQFALAMRVTAQAIFQAQRVIDRDIAKSSEVVR